MDDSQLLKGILEGIVLKIISKGETYGYEILMILEKYGFENLLEGTLYPILTRLNNKGYVKCEKKESPLGPARKYFSITKEGIKKLEEFKTIYKEITKNTNRILLEGEEDDGKYRKL